MPRHHIGTSIRIRKVQEIVRQHYEAGNNARCYRAVWHKFIYPLYPMSYRTFLTYINTRPSELTDGAGLSASTRHGREVSDRVREIQKIVSEHYKAGCRATCKKAVWRNYVYPVYGIDYGSFLQYVNGEVSEPTD